MILGRTRVLYLGPGLQLRPHRNAAATLAVGLANPFELERLEPSPHPRLSSRAALIPSGTLHHLVANGPMAFLYLDANGDDAPAAERSAQSIDLNALQGAADAQTADALGVFETQLRLPEHGLPCGRLGATVAAIDQRPQDFARLTDAAAHAGLSASRFRHVFRTQLGLPFRRYRLWRRMLLVARHVHGGASLTQAALEVGFSSSAHFSEAFRQMFGMSASALLATGVRFEFAD